jgi:hypothetical protein
VSDYIDATTAVRQRRAERDTARAALYALEMQRVRLDRALQRQVRGEGTDDPANASLADRAKDNAAAVARQREVVKQRDASVRDALDALADRRTPPQLIEEWDDGLPILLLPLRLETRWKTDAIAPASPELWVRVYPDDVAITSHEPLLTDAEVTHGHAYWSAVVRAAPTRAEAAAWRALATRFGANRAAWVALQTRPLNWTAASTDPALPLQFPDAPATKPDAWTVAPHTRVLPDRLVLLAWRGETLRVMQVGQPIDDVVVVGPAPITDLEGDESLTRDPLDQTLSLGESFRWVRDFDQAIEKGMAFRVTVAADDVAQGFDRLLVLGLKLSAGADDAQALVEHLIDGHHYAQPGFELLRQGTPTNNTDSSDSGFSDRERDTDESAVAETGPALFEPADDRSVARDGQRLADFLGIAYLPLLHARGADRADHAEAVAMNRALYAGTLGYYLDHMLNEVVSEKSLGALRRHFTDHVTGRGPIAAIRVGRQPYGILPTSALDRWRASTPTQPVPENGGVIALAPSASFESTLLRALRRFDVAWTAVLPSVAQVGSAGEGAARLLEVLGLQPTSAEFYHRVGYSFDYLQNLESLAWGGATFSDVIKMMIEAQGTRSLLTQLGYSAQRANGSPKPLPLLLQLIWRHYHTRLDPNQLIDGQPLSESALIKPLAAGSSATYVDWLIAHATDAAALEAQDLGSGVPRPGSLLYLMLHFSMVMEAARGIRTWLGTRGVSADELVRSRKFLNVGPVPSPSLWEVFRAPANRIVLSEPSGTPLLALMHAPEVVSDAGQSVQEQLDAIAALGSMPTARLERTLVEHVDTLSYRLDAWETSLFARRLSLQRRMDKPVAERRTGLYLGGYGYVEHVQAAGARRQKIDESALPDALRQGVDDLYEEVSNGGYVHAPSLNHATAAALLRSGYLTHASAADASALAVNLSSGRVRRARYLLDGIRSGQSLEALLGVQFERGLHDWTTRPVNPVVLDQLKPVFRAAFPILRTRVPQATDVSGGATVVTEDHQVVNGLTFAKTATPFPYGVPELLALSAQQQDAIRAEKATIENTLDSLRDVLTTESAYQLALGNFDRAAAVLQSAGNGTLPPDIEVLATPRATGISVTQRLAVQLASGAIASPWPTVPLTERARLEPSLNAWLGDLLGAPDSIRCRVAALAADGTVLVDGGGPVEGVVTLADLGVQPIDFVYMVRSQVDETGAAALETRVRFRFARDRGLADDVVVRISFADAGGDPIARSFAEALPLADRLRRMLGTARPLDARHFQSASKDEPAPPDNPGRMDVAELRARVGARLAAVRALFPLVENAANAARATGTIAAADALRDALLAVANAGFDYALPQSAAGAAPRDVTALTRQADALLARFAVLDPATEDQLGVADSATGADEKVRLLGEAVKVWMGSDTLLLPRFDFRDAAAVAQSDAARDTLLAYLRDTVGVPFPVDEWLHGVSCVRPLVHNFEMARTMADALRDVPLDFSPIQLPFRTGDRWLGAEYPPTTEVVHDTVSIVQHLPQGFVATSKQCGLLIDEWVESVPNRTEVTGLSFNFNAADTAPSQALLLAVTPNETGSWQWDDLVGTVLDTFRRARLRAVESDQIGDLPGIGTLLPAVIAEFGTSRGSVSLDYSFVLPAIRDSALTMMDAAASGGGGD